jgi:hypothetical protein
MVDPNGSRSATLLCITGIYIMGDDITTNPRAGQLAEVKNTPDLLRLRLVPNSDGCYTWGRPDALVMNLEQVLPLQVLRPEQMTGRKPLQHINSIPMSYFRSHARYFVTGRIIVRNT